MLTAPFARSATATSPTRARAKRRAKPGGRSPETAARTRRAQRAKRGRSRPLTLFRHCCRGGRRRHSITSSARARTACGTVKAERPRRPQIHDELEGGGKRDRQVARPLAAQDARHVAGGTAEQVGQAGAVGEQGAEMGVEALVGDDGDVLHGRRRHDLARKHRGDEVADDDQRRRIRSAQLAQAHRQIVGSGGVDRHPDGAQPAREGGLLGQLPPGVGGRRDGIVQDANGRKAGDDFRQDFEALAGHLLAEGSEAGDRAAGPCQAREQLRVAVGRRQPHRHQRDRGGLADRARGHGASHKEHVHRQRDQTPYDLPCSGKVATRVAILDGVGLSLHLAEGAHAFPERGEVPLGGRRGGEAHIADCRRSARPLRAGEAGGESEGGNEQAAADHAIIASAAEVSGPPAPGRRLVGSDRALSLDRLRARKVGGVSSPSALMVPRLTVRSAGMARISKASPEARPDCPAHSEERRRGFALRRTHGRACLGGSRR